MHNRVGREVAAKREKLNCGQQARRRLERAGRKRARAFACWRGWVTADQQARAVAGEKEALRALVNQWLTEDD
jgi:hypothetical protein